MVVFQLSCYDVLDGDEIVKYNKTFLMLFCHIIMQEYQVIIWLMTVFEFIERCCFHKHWNYLIIIITWFMLCGHLSFCLIIIKMQTNGVFTDHATKTQKLKAPHNICYLFMSVIFLRVSIKGDTYYKNFGKFEVLNKVQAIFA